MTSRYYNSNLIVILLSFLCIVSCGRIKIKKKLSEMQGRSLRLSFDDMLYIGGKDNPCKTKELTWIVYHDSVNCKPCLIGHLPDWDSIRNHPTTDCVFIFSAKPEEVSQYVKAYKENYIVAKVYLDTAEVFLKSNPQIPKETIYHTFLIDNHDSILLVGNPIRNEGVCRIYEKIKNTRK